MKPQMVMILKKLFIGGFVLIILWGIYNLSTASRVQPTLQPHVIVPGLTGKTVIIDPGHGGVDPGATVGNIREADLNMDLANSLKNQLEAIGAKAALTRIGDQGLVPQEMMTNSDQGFILTQRKEFAAHLGGQLFISIHVNSNNDKRVSGGIVYYSDTASRPLAEAIQQQLNQFSGKSWQPRDKAFTITKGNSMPTVLVETAFLTNSDDLEILTSKPELLAQAIFEGIRDYAQNYMITEEQPN